MRNPGSTPGEPQTGPSDFYGWYPQDVWASGGVIARGSGLLWTMLATPAAPEGPPDRHGRVFSKSFLSAKLSL